MPSIKKSESKKDYIARCVPYVIKNEGAKPGEAWQKCNGMYEQHKKKGTQYSLSELRQLIRIAKANNKQLEKSHSEINTYEEGKYYEFTFNASLSDVLKDVSSNDDKINELVNSAISDNGYSMTIVVGNRFMHGIWISASEIKQIYKGWNGTLHDINHMGSGYMAGFSVVPSDISYIVGYQDSLTFDESTNEVKANLHIEKNAPKFNVWKNYMDICAKINRIPNVSMFVYGKIKYVQASEMPMECNYKENGFSENDLIPCMIDILPYMVSTVTRGTCDDKKGCGIK